MRTLAAFRNVLAAALLAGSLAPPSAPAAPAPPDKDAAAGSVPNPREGLDQVVTLDIDRQSLSAAVAQLRDKTKLNIVLDNQALQQVGVNPDQPAAPAQADLKDVKVRAALRTLLTPYNLTFVVIGDSVVITTEEEATARQMGQRVSVHLDKVEFAAALKQIARDTGVNLPLDPRADKEASAKVSLDADDIPLETAVRLLAEMAGLKPVRAANTLFVTKKEVAAAMRADLDLNPAAPAATTTGSGGDNNTVNAVVWLGRGGAQSQVLVLPAAGLGSAPVKQIEAPAPANPDSPPAPEKKDDK
jgi:hypothetical protein